MKLAREQVVVTGDQRRRRAASLDLPRELVRARVVTRREAVRVPGRGRRVGLDHAERVEAPGDGRCAGAAASSKAPTVAGSARPTSPSTKRVTSTPSAKRTTSGPMPSRAAMRRGLVLVLPVDPEQGRVLAADPQDQRLAVDDDLEVVVGDPAAERLTQRLDVHRLSGPEPPDRLLDAHARS